MPVSPTYHPDPLFQTLGPEFADPVEPARFPQSIIRFRNDRAAATVGLDTLTDEEWITHFARFEPLPGNQPRPLAMRYHGHQFRSYNPEIGDGRGFLFAQMREAGTGRLLDLGTKGSGQTPYSRFGDGRLTLKGAVREVLAAEMLQASGVPTCRILSVIETGEELERNDEPSPTRGAVMVRLQHSHVRFGAFQRHAFHNRADRIQTLIDHVVAAYYPHLAAHEGAARAAPLLAGIARVQANLCARWMAAGFVHGVLNTDNLNVTGESFDYGPWRFLPRMDAAFTAAYFDQTGLYAYGRQPEAVFWNLTQLAGCFALIEEAEPLIAAVNTFGPAYEQAMTVAVLNRLGVAPLEPAADLEFVNAVFRFMGQADEAIRFEPLFFDWFCGMASEARAFGGARRDLYATPAFDEVRTGLAERTPLRPERLTHPFFMQAEPEEMLIGEVEAIWAAIADGDDWSPFIHKVARIRAAGEAQSLDPAHFDAPPRLWMESS
ncbi:MAG: protein adenylyltransferase SelO family protein [Caulobacteraceae bacterium]